MDDNAAYDLLVDAARTLEEAAGNALTIRASTALSAAARVLELMALGLLIAGEDDNLQ